MGAERNGIYERGLCTPKKSRTLERSRDVPKLEFCRSRNRLMYFGAVEPSFN